MVSSFYFSFSLLKAHSFRHPIESKMTTAYGMIRASTAFGVPNAHLLGMPPKTHRPFPFKLLTSRQIVYSIGVLGYTLTRAFCCHDIKMPCLLVLCHPSCGKVLSRLKKQLSIKKARCPVPKDRGILPSSFMVRAAPIPTVC